MRRYVILALGVAMASVVIVSVALADNNTSAIQGKVTPSKLPADRFKKISLEVDTSTVENGGGTPTAPTKLPDPTSHVTVDFDDSGRLTTAGLPQCDVATLENTTTAQAEALCGPGSANNAEITLHRDGTSNPGSATVCLSDGIEGHPCGIVLNPQIVAFNGIPDSKGRPTTIFHTRVGSPVNQTTIIVGTVKNSTFGADYGKALDVPVPPIAGGTGALTDFHVTVYRDYTVSGVTKHYLRAKCDDADHLLNIHAKFTYSTDNGNPGGTDDASDAKTCTPV